MIQEVPNGKGAVDRMRWLDPPHSCEKVVMDALKMNPCLLNPVPPMEKQRPRKEPMGITQGGTDEHTFHKAKDLQDWLGHQQVHTNHDLHVKAIDLMLGVLEMRQGESNYYTAAVEVNESAYTLPCKQETAFHKPMEEGLRQNNETHARVMFSNPVDVSLG